ncbi:MAG: AAC(3) family N-acetyltransferase, partial [Lachnospiraceae bacterium]|nr:AAC(3) family N-acetyltransferase [Lachnospiraceae bacterium]
MKVVIKEDIVNELKRVGLKKNDVVMGHTSLKSMGYICGGAQTVIEALLEVVGEDGTIIMPTQSW